jgi:hypothetical protein
MRTGLFGALALIFTGLTIYAYDFITVPPIHWPDGDIPMDLQLDLTITSQRLSDGKSSWNAVAREALGLWNAQLSRVQFTTFTDTSRGDGNDKNEVFFSSNVYGQRFGSYVLAITTTWRVGTQRIEGDTVFNSGINWDSYRGPLDTSVVDLRRVATHEFGHTLGLDHPDQARQIVVSIMNAVVSDLDTLAIDDIHGARALYPPDARYALNIEIPAPDAGTVLATPPPDGDGKYQAGTLVVLRAAPNRKNHFDFWGGDENALGKMLKVRVVADETIVASFSTNVVPRILQQPRSQEADSSSSVTFRVRAASASRVSFQWQFNGTDIPAATEPQLAVNFLTHQDSGLYSCRITNARGETFSKPARLVVNGY